MPMLTVGHWLDRGEKELRRSDVPEARANAEWIMADVLRARRTELLLHASRALTQRQQKSYWHHVVRRGRRLPLAYVLGHQTFMGLELEVGEGVLVPRPETEELVAEAARLLKPREREPLRFLEIGTGSGCIAIALAAAFPRAAIWATDVSAAALDLAVRNAERHGRSRQIRFVREDFLKEGFGQGTGWADLVVSNPPYIPTRRLATLEPEVLKEPRLALDGGPDGLDAIRAIAAAAPSLLSNGGLLALEIDSEQGAAASKLLGSLGLSDVAIRKDAQGLDRIAVARK